MIYTKINQLDRYLGISDSLDAAIRYLMTADLTALQPGRNEISGDDAYINRFGYDTMPEEQAIWEGHIGYGDIHIVLGGHDKIGISNAADLTETVRKEAEDFVGYEGPVQAWAPMVPGFALIVYPEDVHMVKVSDGEACHVDKAVVKFKV